MLCVGGESESRCARGMGAHVGPGITASRPFELTVEGGGISHDLGRTFATELRTRQVHEYDIADLLGHTIQSVTGTYARSTPDGLEDAVNRLTESRGNVIQFKRKIS